MRFNRRHAMLATCAACAMRPVPALASSRSDTRPRGCLGAQIADLHAISAIEIIDGKLAGETTGNPEVDTALGLALVRMAPFFSVRPYVALYDEGPDEKPNALATPTPVRPNSDGSVLLGRRLLRRQIEQYPDAGVSVVAILAHEFAHLIQFSNRLDNPNATPEYPLTMANGSEMLLELHADFFAGLYLAYLKNNLDGIKLFNAGETIRSLGDTDFTSPEHHGTPEQRARSIDFGYRVGIRNPGYRPKQILTESMAFISKAFGQG